MKRPLQSTVKRHRPWGLALSKTGPRVEFYNSFSSIDPTLWDRLAGSENPFLSHAFFSALEDSGCIGVGTSWRPCPAVSYNAQGSAVAAASCFLKYDSTGEYVFDYSWADAYQRLYGSTQSYYPKLQIAVPFSPVPGPRLLVDRTLDKDAQAVAENQLLGSFLQLAQQNGLSSVHITFCEQEEASRACSELPYLHRIGEQYHWFNRDYESFDDFLEQLSSRKRKAIRRERKIAQEHPVSFHTVHGDRATPQQWDAMYALYVRTARSKWGRPYLNREFFRLLGERLKDKVVLFLVRSEPDGEWLAGAWNLRGEKALFGRNWGCRQELPMLHFEVCYYRAIEYAIAHKLDRVEAGAQGMHKIQRGYQPVTTHSVHHLFDEPFAAMVCDYLAEERKEELERLSQLQELSPFRQSQAQPR